MVIVPKLTEFKKHLNNTLGNSAVRGQELDPMILVDPFQLRILCNSVFQDFCESMWTIQKEEDCPMEETNKDLN